MLKVTVETMMGELTVMPPREMKVRAAVAFATAMGEWVDAAMEAMPSMPADVARRMANGMNVSIGDRG